MDDPIYKMTKRVMARLNENNFTYKTPIISGSTTRNYIVQKSSSSVTKKGNAIIILAGGEENLDIVFQQISIINEQVANLTVVMTRSAEVKIGLPKLRQQAYEAKFITNWSENYKDIISKTDILYIPTLTLNIASKCAQLITDNVVLIFIVSAILRGIKVRMATNSLYPTDIIRSKSLIPTGVQNKINSIQNQLRDLGVELVDISDLTNNTSSHSNIPIPLIINPIIKSDNIVDITENHEVCSPENDKCTSCGHCSELNPSGVNNLINAGADRIGASIGTKCPPKVAPLIDHTLLKADATSNEIKQLCEEAARYKFASVMVNPSNVALASKYLKNVPEVKVGTVIGFPLGATTSTTKAIETRDAISNGANEIDMVINVGALKSNDDTKVLKDIQSVVEAARGKAIVKVILETALLSREDIVKGSYLAKKAGADYVKTSTGFSTGGATVENLLLMRQTVGPFMGIKASGGIRDYETAQKMIEAGATRIGASASVAIAKTEMNFLKGMWCD